MFRTHLLFLLPLLFSLSLSSCTQDLEVGHGAGPELRALYTVQWNTDHTRVSVLAPTTHGGTDAGDQTICKNGTISGRALICPDRIVHLESGAESYFSYALRGPRSAALGAYDRIAYVLDQAGDLHVTDTGWSAAASDDLPLLLWSPGQDHVELLAGNARRQLALVELQGGLKLWAVNETALYVLYQNRLHDGWSWGVERISLADYQVEPVQPEQLVADPDEIPEALRISEEGHLKIYRNGAVLTDLPL